MARIGRFAGWLALGAMVVIPMTLVEGSFGFRLLIGFLLIALIGLIRSVVDVLRTAKSSKQGTKGPNRPRPADGEVEWISLRSVGAEPIADHERVRRFLSFEDITDPIVRHRAALAPLLGRVAFLSVFLGYPRSHWSDGEIARMCEALLRAGRWVEREALRWGAGVNVDLVDTVFVLDDPEPLETEVALISGRIGGENELFDADADLRTLAALTRGAVALGCSGVADLIEQAERRLPPGIDAAVWFVHSRSAGRSFVLIERHRPIPNALVSLCYARTTEVPEPLVGPPYPDPTTFVHELMHLFGASDKYNIPLRRLVGKGVSQYDVMRLEYDSLSRLRVDPATAHEIGWTNDPLAWPRDVPKSRLRERRSEMRDAP